ncbi:hypothetical protein KIPB_009612 [Kipferlia bialata]|uniref:Uncharacterized protein n=1 Tax=Kipferlia bialata TaxID=797122 RepID=A0A391NP82_9EUKA|nr:hypothetical protein KIPB_009612 [Kipferlia bialata]|eukprot:g9612.t1
MTHTKREDRVIDWTYPEPTGAGSKFFGPGATTAELVIQQVFPYTFGLFLPVLAYLKGWGWTWYQCVAAALLGCDMLGGVMTNATSAAKRWYHRDEQTFWNHMSFTATHILQPLVLMACFDRWNWCFVAVSYGYLLVASVVILTSPQYLQRPIAMLLLVVGIFISLYVIPAPVHFEWFLPLFYIKLLCCHLLIEEPYRPKREEREVKKEE